MICDTIRYLHRAIDYFGLASCNSIATIIIMITAKGKRWKEYGMFAGITEIDLGKQFPKTITNMACAVHIQHN